GLACRSSPPRSHSPRPTTAARAFREREPFADDPRRNPFVPSRRPAEGSRSHLRAGPVPSERRQGGTGIAIHRCCQVRSPSSPVLDLLVKELLGLGPIAAGQR